MDKNILSVKYEFGGEWSYDEGNDKWSYRKGKNYLIRVKVDMPLEEVLLKFSEKREIDLSKDKLVLKLLYENLAGPIDVVDDDTWIGFLDDLIRRSNVRLCVNTEAVIDVHHSNTDNMDLNEDPVVGGINDFSPELLCNQNTRQQYLPIPSVSRTPHEIAIRPNRTVCNEVIDLTSQCGFDWGQYANMPGQPLPLPITDQPMNIRSTPITDKQHMITPEIQQPIGGGRQQVIASSSRLDTMGKTNQNFNLHMMQHRPRTFTPPPMQHSHHPPTFTLPPMQPQTPPNLNVGGSFMTFLTSPIQQNLEIAPNFSNACINRNRGDHFGSTIENLDDIPPCPQVEAFESENPDLLYVGKKFRNKEDMRTKMSYHALRNDYMWRLVRSDPTTLRLKCGISDNCKWKVVGKLVVDPDVNEQRSKMFEITKYTDAHNCGLEVLTDCHKQAKPGAIGRFVRDNLMKLGEGFTTNVLIAQVKTKFNVTLNYARAYQCRQRALELTGGNVTMSYGKLASYFYMLKKENTGTETEIIPDDLGRFKYCFMALGSSIEGFRYCRPILIVDGTHLKTKCGGTLLIAVGVDADEHVFPLAFAVTDGESLEAWEYFLQKIRSIIGDRENMAFVSDRAPGIIGAVRNTFPNAYHGYCYHHIVMNLNHKFGSTGYCPYTFYEAAYTFSETKFKIAFQKIIDMDQNDQKPVARYLQNIGFDKWARSQFPGTRYAIMTSNHAESFNNVIRSARKKSIVNLFEYIRALVQRWHLQRRETADKCETVLAKVPEKYLNRNARTRTSFSMTQIDHDQYQVGDVDTSAKVNILRRECYCGEFQGLQIPCVHACVAISHRNESAYTYCSEYYKASRFKYIYQGRVYPVPVEEDWIVPLSIQNEVYLAPNHGVGDGGETQHMSGERRGRPRINRFPSQGEPTGGRTTRTTRMTVERTIPGSGRCCSKCGNPGHRCNRCPHT